MIEILGRKMRFIFQQPASPPAKPQTASTGSPMIVFSAWAEDCRLFGSLELDGDRLSDMLNLYDEFVLVDVQAQDHDGGPATQISELAISRDDILLVEASPPRGHPQRRRHMQPVPISVELGDFALRGDVHVSPGADPLLALSRRAPMVPLTRAQLTYRGGLQRLTEAADATVLFNRQRVTSIEVGNRRLPKLNDLTGAA
jgi:hypothetical protein